MSDYELSTSAPSPEEYLLLRAEAGLHPKTLEQARGAIAGSWAFRHVRAGGEAVAMGRVVGDGGWYFLIADMAVLPAHQRRGLGSRILDALLTELRERVPGAYVSLTANPEGVGLYRSRGFHDSFPPYLGMEQVLGPASDLAAPARAVPRSGGTPS